jgi:hypothetical protein
MEDLIRKNFEITTIQIDKEVTKIRYRWTCDACGGDSDTGCLMSDPQDCVRG